MSYNRERRSKPTAGGYIFLGMVLFVVGLLTYNGSGVGALFWYDTVILVVSGAVSMLFGVFKLLHNRTFESKPPIGEGAT
ncbi:MAG TPA: hypothetical protein VJN71_08045 [Nitrososphaerales archaeon]|nr:hypothetical protein [Nitrososphaerales archaeon]